MTQTLETIAANAERAERDRQVPLENIELLRDAGLLRSLQPERYGGEPVGAEEYCPMLVDVAQACASTAWVAGLYAQHSYVVGLMSEELQDEVWGEEPDALIASSIAAITDGVETTGGVLLNGSWGFSSGCDHSDWAVLGFKRAVPELDGMPVPHFALVPRSDFAILDDWHVAGLRGTGSKTLKLEDVFVPNHRIDSLPALSTGSSKGFGLHGGIFHSSFGFWFALGFSAVSLGISQRFCHLYAERAKTRVRAYTGVAAVNSVPAAMRLAESHHQLSAAQASLEKDWRLMTATALREELPDEDTAVHWRANQSYATHMAIEALDRLWTASGGSAFYESNEMQRLWRDSKMTGGHAYSDYDMARQRHGRHLLGLPRDPTIF
ncbi:MAG: hypothetical protein R2743_19660 [Ilumatobacteraceae bacterium]